MNRTKIFAAAVSSAFVLSVAVVGCGGGDETAEPSSTTVTETQQADPTRPAASPETVTQTRTETAEPVEPVEPVEPEPVTEEPADSPSSVDPIVSSAFDLTWDGMSESDQADVCEGWELSPELMLDAFMEGAGESDFTRDDIRTLIDGKCA